MKISQPDLFARRAPYSKPGTSQVAARLIDDNADTLRQSVLDALTSAGEQGMTDPEIQAALGMAGDTERPRRWELVHAGKVQDSGQVRQTATGRWASVWVATHFPPVGLGSPDTNTESDYS